MKKINPSLISEGMIDAVNDKLRIQNPCVRAGWYHDYLNESENNNIASDRAREKEEMMNLLKFHGQRL